MKKAEGIALATLGGAVMLYGAYSNRNTNQIPSNEPPAIRLQDSLTPIRPVLTPTESPMRLGADIPAIKEMYPALASYPMREIKIPSPGQEVSLYNLSDYNVNVDAFIKLRNHLIDLAMQKKQFSTVTRSRQPAKIEFNRLEIPKWTYVLVSPKHPNYLSDKELENPYEQDFHQFGSTDTDGTNVGMVVVRQPSEAQLKKFKEYSDLLYVENTATFMNAVLGTELCNSVIMAKMREAKAPQTELPYDLLSNEALCGATGIAIGYRLMDNISYEEYKKSTLGRRMEVLGVRIPLITIPEDDYLAIPNTPLLTSKT